MFDLHNDFPTVIPLARYAQYLSRYPRATVTAAIFTSELDESRATELVGQMTAALSAQGAGPIAIEDLGALDLAAFGFEYERYFYCSLTWNFDNRFAGGALGSGELTADGKAVISAMNRARCAVDLAHLNKKSFYAALDLAEFPMCSHTGFSDHPRCLDARQVRALIERHAVIGLCAVRKFTGANSAARLAETIDEFVQKFGAEYLCLGTDFNGSADLPNDFKDYSDIPVLTAALGALGYAKRDIDKILYSNAARFYEELKS